MNQRVKLLLLQVGMVALGIAVAAYILSRDGSNLVALAMIAAGIWAAWATGKRAKAD